MLFFGLVYDFMFLIFCVHRELFKLLFVILGKLFRYFYNFNWHF